MRLGQGVCGRGLLHSEERAGCAWQGQQGRSLGGHEHPIAKAMMWQDHMRRGGMHTLCQGKDVEGPHGVSPGLGLRVRVVQCSGGSPTNQSP